MSDQNINQIDIIIIIGYLILVFGISLITCTFLQQVPSVKIARRCQFLRIPNQFSRLKVSTLLNNFSLSKILTRLKQSEYSIFQQKNIIYCYKALCRIFFDSS